MPTKPATKKTSSKTARTTRKLALSPSPLRASALPRKDLVDVGARYNVSNLTDHAAAVLSKVTAQNADASATEHFSDYGLDAAWVSAVEGLIAQIGESSDTKGELASNALPTAAALQAAFTTVKELRRQGVTAIAADPTRGSALGALGTGGSVPAARRSLAKVAAQVPVGAVTPSGTGKELRAKAQVALKALDAAEKAHRAALAKLSPAATQAHAAKGILQAELKSAARVARTVSPSDAALYAISTHTRVRAPSRKAKSANGATAASQPATSPGTGAKS